MLNNQSNVLPAKRSTRPRPGANTSTPFSRAHSATESVAVTTHSMWCSRASKSAPHSTSSEPSPIRAQPNFVGADEILILNILKKLLQPPPTRFVPQTLAGWARWHEKTALVDVQT